MDYLTILLNEVKGKRNTKPQPEEDDINNDTDNQASDYTIDDEETDTDDNAQQEENSDGEAENNQDINDNSDGPTDYSLDNDESSNSEYGEGGDDTSIENDESNTKILQLFRNYEKLYNGISDILIELNNFSPRTNLESNLMKRIVENLRNARNTIYDYITIKFNTKSYQENMMNFYFFKNSLDFNSKLIEKIKVFRNED